MIQPRFGAARGRAGRMERGMGFGGPALTCMCPACGYQEQKARGIPCASKKCPKCGTQMIRGD